MTSDGKGTKPDAPKPSAEKTPDPSTPSKTYDQKQVDTLLSERHSTLDKKVDALTRTVESNKTSTTALNTRLRTAEELNTTLRKTAEEASFNALPQGEGRADALTQWTKDQAFKDEKTTFAVQQQTLADAITANAANMAEMAEFNKGKAATEIVSRDEFKGVKADDLTKLTDGSPDKMEALAKILVIANNPNSAMPVDPSKPLETPPDSGQNIGGAGQLSNEQRENMSVEDYVNHPANKNRFKDTYEQSRSA